MLKETYGGEKNQTMEKTPRGDQHCMLPAWEVLVKRKIYERIT